MKNDKYIRSIAISLAASASLAVTATSLAAPPSSGVTATFPDAIVVDCMGSGDYETLQEAVDAAESGDTINVLPCTYIVDNQDGDVLIESKELHIVSTRGPEETFIEVDKTYSIIVDGNFLTDVTLEGFTIRQSDAGAQTAVRQFAGELHIVNCVFSDNGRFADQGGAIYATEFLVLDVRHSMFESNYASAGGAIYAEDASPSGIVEIMHSDFLSNESSGLGGAVYLEDTSFAIFNVDFIGNGAPSSSGGALFYSANDPGYVANIDSAVFSKNTALNGGGAILFDRSESEVIVQACRFEKNSVSGDHSYGGAVQTENSYSRFEHCVFRKNQCYYGGAIDVFVSDAHFAWCEFEKNKSDYGAGGINLEEANVSLEHVTLTKNKTANDSGGGILCEESTAALSNVHFSKNKAVEGGGLYAHDSNVTLTDTLFEKNKATISIEAVDNIGGAMSLTESSIRFKDLEVLNNKTGGSVGGISLDTCDGKIVKCTIEDNEDYGLRLLDSPTVEVKKTTSCNNDAKDINGDFIDEGDNLFCNE